MEHKSFEIWGLFGPKKALNNAQNLTSLKFPLKQSRKKNLSLALDFSAPLPLFNFFKGLVWPNQPNTAKCPLGFKTEDWRWFAACDQTGWPEMTCKFICNTFLTCKFICNKFAKLASQIIFLCVFFLLVFFFLSEHRSICFVWWPRYGDMCTISWTYEMYCDKFGILLLIVWVSQKL